jgi:hypothetical protein
MAAKCRLSLNLNADLCQDVNIVLRIGLREENRNLGPNGLDRREANHAGATGTLIIAGNCVCVPNPRTQFTVKLPEVTDAGDIETRYCPHFHPRALRMNAEMPHFNPAAIFSVHNTISMNGWE